MYLDQTSIELNALRQGDVLSQVHLLGVININAVRHTIDNTGKRVGWSVQSPAIIGDAMVLSHSCEIIPENNLKFTGVILAPLRDINTATDMSKVKELIDSNVLSEGSTKSFLKYFYLEPHEKLAYKDGAVVDFSKCFSVRKNYFDELLKKKVAQLDNVAVSNMATKLALYFYRAEKV